VTGSGQVINIGLAWWAGGAALGALGQNPFQVMSERVDPVSHVISVVTLAGHPLAGWRYWRVYSIGTNDVVIETGAYDQPGPGQANYAGYYLSKPVILNTWSQYVRYFLTHVSLQQGTQLGNILGISNGQLVHGYWDYDGSFTNYILNNVCRMTVCN
jgi:hypothetical protein